MEKSQGRQAKDRNSGRRKRQWEKESSAFGIRKRHTHLWILCVAAYDGEASERKRDRDREEERRGDEWRVNEGR